MPFESEKQRQYMHIHHPEIAKRWEHESGHYGKDPRMGDPILDQIFNPTPSNTATKHAGPRDMDSLSATVT
jgi:hypothetical protein